jgi:hypothetical protein
MYDYGAEGNKQHYGQNTPPQYNVGNMKIVSMLGTCLIDPCRLKPKTVKLELAANSLNTKI